MALTDAALAWSVNEQITNTHIKQGVYADMVTDLSSQPIGERCAAHGISGVDCHDPRFHQKWRRCSSSPSVMYRMGEYSLMDSPLLALIGPRKPSSYLKEVTKQICTHMGAYTLATISGGAEGIDRLAHDVSIEQGLPTIVVLGAGFRRYTRRQEWLFLEKVVAAGGLVISERKIDQSPKVYTYPQRNRIIACCADLVFVPGAGVGSGSLITVDFALQFGIPVVTVPGSVYDPLSAGTNAYIVERKIDVITDFDELLQRYFIKKSGKRAVGASAGSYLLELSAQQRILLDQLAIGPADVSTLAMKANLSPQVVLTYLFHFELHHLVHMEEPGVYALT